MSKTTAGPGDTGSAAHLQLSGGSSGAAASAMALQPIGQARPERLQRWLGMALAGDIRAGPGGRPHDLVDELEIEVGLGGRVLVVSDLLLGPTATPASSSATTDLARAIEAWSGPGALIVAGNLFELLVAEPGRGSPDPGAALDAHPRLTAALRAFGAGDGRRLSRRARGGPARPEGDAVSRSSAPA